MQSIENMKELADYLIEAIPFCRLFNMKIKHIAENTATITFVNRADFIGNMIKGILHGGVIASAIDSVGGVCVMSEQYHRYQDLSHEEQVAKLGKIGTIDLRVDYLQPGRGEQFECHAHIIRGGNRVSVTRMEFCNEENVLIAVGTGTYLIG